MAVMKFYCRKCGQKLSADESQAGRVVYCPSCNGMMTVPLPGQPVHEPDLDHQQHVLRRGIDVPYVEDDVDRSSAIALKHMENIHSHILFWCWLAGIVFFSLMIVVPIISKEIFTFIPFLAMLFGAVFVYQFEMTRYHLQKCFYGSLYGLYKNVKKIDMRIRKINLGD